MLRALSVHRPWVSAGMGHPPCGSTVRSGQPVSVPHLPFGTNTSSLYPTSTSPLLVRNHFPLSYQPPQTLLKSLPPPFLAAPSGTHGPPSALPQAAPPRLSAVRPQSFTARPAWRSGTRLQRGFVTPQQKSEETRNPNPAQPQVRAASSAARRDPKEREIRRCT